MANRDRGMTMTGAGGYSMDAACRLLWDAYGDAGVLQRALAAVRPLIARFDRVVAHLPREKRLFDIGCGNGLLLAIAGRFAAAAPGSAGVDTNSAAIAAAKRMASAGSLSLTFQTGGKPEEWPDGQYDVVTMVDVLHHVPFSFRRGLIEAALSRVVPGGVFLYKDMCARPSYRRMWNQFHDLLLAKQLVVVEPVEHVIGWVTEAGFERVASERYVGAALYGHELEVFRRPGIAMDTPAVPERTR